MKRAVYRHALGLVAGAALVVASSSATLACEAHKTAAQMTEAPQSMAQGQVTAEDVWVPLAPPGVKAHAAYLVLKNGGTDQRSVMNVSSPQYGAAALHVSETNKDGVTMMQHLAQLDVAGGSSVAFKPHGLHIMLMNPKRVQKSGDTVDLTFTFDDGTALTVTGEVRLRRSTGAQPMNHDHLHHHKGS